ncbi:MAG TPA: Hsp20/alpha crystallin family protein [Candidatus Brocadiia bacterium]|nr:Hsp20/alpha crystallin family protein [Candidatus Brocadiales bacterium]
MKKEQEETLMTSDDEIGKKYTKRQQADRKRISYRRLRYIKTMRGAEKQVPRTCFSTRHREKIAHPSIPETSSGQALANFKAVLAQLKNAYEEGGDTSNVPLAGVGRTGDLAIGTVSRPPLDKVRHGESASGTTIKPWVFTTKPQFKRLEKSFKKPMVDVFDEASEIQIIIDLGNFKRGEIDIDIKPDKYVIFAKKGSQEFREEIVLPSGVDLENTEERFKNGILQIILPKKESPKT